MFIENIDYIRFDIMSNGNLTKDFMLKIEMAQKKLDNYQIQILELQENIQNNKQRVSFAEIIEKSSDSILIRDLSKICRSGNIQSN